MGFMEGQCGFNRRDFTLQALIIHARAAPDPMGGVAAVKSGIDGG